MQQKTLKDNNKIGFTAIIFAIYVALTPVHQALLLPTGDTVNKYISYALVLAILFRMEHINKEMIRYVLLFVVWISVTLLWSPYHSPGNLTTTLSHIVLLVFCCSTVWRKREIDLIRKSLIISSIYFSIILIVLQGDEEVRRSTISFGMSETKTDMNCLSANIGMGLLFSLSYFFLSKKKLWKLLMFACIFVILLGILATGSRGALIAVIIASFYFVLSTSKRQRLRVGAIIGFALGIAFFILYIFQGGNFLGETVLNRFMNPEQMEGGDGRIKIWENYFAILADMPLIFLAGYGFPQSNTLYSEYYMTQFAPATHSDYIGLICSCGIIGLIFAGVFVRYIWKTAKQKVNVTGMSCMVLALIMSLTINFFDTYGWWNALIFAYIGELQFEATNEN